MREHHEESLAEMVTERSAVRARRVMELAASKTAAIAGSYDSELRATARQREVDRLDLEGQIRGLKRVVADASSELAQLRATLQESQAELEQSVSWRRTEMRSRAELRDRLCKTQTLLRFAMHAHVPQALHHHYEHPNVRCLRL